ncbi:MAG: thiol-disulfide isomerase [Bryobacteraceae bacterium]
MPRNAILLLAAGFLAIPALNAAAPTFNKDVAPILFKHCTSCHRPKEVAPMSLLDYKSARPWAKSIKQAVATRKMPPWFADAKHGHFSNDPRLSEAEIATVRAWADAGAPEGDARDLPAQPQYATGWLLGKPDLVIDTGADYEVKPGDDAYEHFVVKTNFKEGKWITAAEIKPGDREVVHHVHVLLVQETPGAMEVASTKNMPALSQFLIKEDKLTRIRQDAPVVNDACASSLPDLPYLRGAQDGSLAAYLPGRPPDRFPDGFAKWIPPGAKLEFVIHYARTNGKVKHVDRTSVGFHVISKPERVMKRMDLRNFFFAIPAGASAHEVRRCFEFDSERTLVSFTPHLHYRGKDIVYELVRPNGAHEILLSVPHYDFNWQLTYRLAKPVTVPKGSRLIVTAHYDNSANNKANPDPKQIVRWGDRSEEEMMTSWIEYFDAGVAARPAGPTETARR